MKIKTLVAAMVFPLAYAMVYAEVPATMDLTGHANLPKGRSGAATLYITHATLKTNFESSVFTRYPILPRRAQTRSDGNFKIESLDARWLYSGDVVAPGCKLHPLSQIDPTAGPLEISLEAADTNAPPNQTIHGRVLEANGHGISGALIEITGTMRNGQGTWPGQDIDYLSVSDDGGNFVVYGKTPFAAVDGKVHANGFAEAWFEQWPSDAVNQEWSRTGTMPDGFFQYADAKPLHEITLVKGAALQGRLMQNGRAVANAEIRLNQCTAGSNCWFWQGATLTDDHGRFLFQHLPLHQGYCVCGNWDLPAIAGVVPQTEVKTGKDGSTNDIGDLTLQSVSQVAGRIRLSDGKPIPSNSRYFLSDDAMGGSLSSVIRADGSFQFAAVPGDKISIFFRVPGYEFTPHDGFRIAGTVTNIIVVPDLTNLVFELKPASWPATIRR